MRKKKLIEQNLSLFDELQKTQTELIELKKQLNKSNDEIKVLKALVDEKEIKPQENVTEPMHRLEERVIFNASLKPDMEYGSIIIGKIVVSAAEYSNKLTMGGNDSNKELVNLILGKTELAKAEILSVIETADSFELKSAKMDQILAVTNEYFESVIAQIV